MTTGNLPSPRQPDQGHSTNSFPALPPLSISSSTELAEAKQRIKECTVPAGPMAVGVRVMALLSNYYTVDVPQALRQVEADDWIDALAKFPEWAITKACRWWKSDANPDRRKKPLEGDIVARCKFEMEWIDLAERAVRNYGQPPILKPVAPRDPNEPRCSPEAAAAILANAKLKGMSA